MCPFCEKTNLPQSQWSEIESIFIEVFRDDFLELSPDEFKRLTHRVASAESVEDVKVISLRGEMNCEVNVDPAWIALGLNFIQTVLQFIALKYSAKKHSPDDDIEFDAQEPSFDDFLEYAKDHIIDSPTLEKYNLLMDEYFAVYKLFMKKRGIAFNHDDSCMGKSVDDENEERI